MPDRAARRRPAAVDAVVAVARNPGLRALQVASVAWSGAEAAYLVGLLVAAHDLAGTPAVATLAVVRALPSVVLAPLLTAVLDRHAPAVQLRGVLSARLAIVAMLAVALAGAGSIGVLLVLAGADAVAATLLRPVRGALVPALASTPDELVAANVATSTGESLAAMLGPAVAAALLVVSGPQACLWAGVIVMVGALAAAAAVRATELGHIGIHERAPRPRGRVGRFGGFAGVPELLAMPHARLIVAVLVAQRLVRGMLAVLVVAAAVDFLRMGDAGVGVLSSAIGLGGVVGGAAAVGLLGGARLAPWFAGGVVLWGLGIGMPGLVAEPVAAAAFLGVAGAGKLVLDVSGFSLLQRTVPAEVRGRVLGTLEGLVSAALGVGPLLAAWLVATFDVAGALLVAGAIPIVAAGVSWPVLRSADDAAVIPERELALLRRVPMFDALRLNNLEILAGAVEWTRVPAGREVVREGEYGDRFYVVETGRLAVSVGGQDLRELGSGASFGEIALLHARPRSATVRAGEDSVVASIDGEAFLAAINGHHESAAAAEAQAAERLAAAGS